MSEYKIKLELAIALLSFFVVLLFILTYKTGLTDNYFHYLVAKQIIKTPEMLYKPIPPDHPGRLYTTPWSGGNSIYFYPPLTHLLLAVVFLLKLSPEMLFILSFGVVLFLVYKIKPEAVVFLFVSFMLIRVVIHGSNDVLITALALASFYFFEKKPLLSGFLAGLCPLVKGTGFLFLGSYFLCIILIKHKELLTLKFFRSKYFYVFLIALFTLVPWYGRNFILTNGDLFNTFIGQSTEEVTTGEAWLKSGDQASQPERSIIDISGFYPLPVDLLFYMGIGFTIYNLAKIKKLNLEYIIIIIYVLIYFLFNLLHQTWLSPWRYYLPIYPLLAIEIGKFIKNVDKEVKLALYGIAIFLFVVWLFYIPQYSFNGHWAGVNNVCLKYKYLAGTGSVYVESYNNWFVIYACNFNATTKNYANWIVVVNDFKDFRSELNETQNNSNNSSV